MESKTLITKQILINIYRKIFLIEILRVIWKVHNANKIRWNRQLFYIIVKITYKQSLKFKYSIMKLGHLKIMNRTFLKHGNYTKLSSADHEKLAVLSKNSFQIWKFYKYKRKHTYIIDCDVYGRIKCDEKNCDKFSESRYLFAYVTTY